MQAIIALLGKDLRLLARDRGAVFLTFAWPLVLAIFFGALGPGFGAQTSSDATAMTVLAVDELGIHVCCADGVARVAELQPPGKRRMPAKDYAVGQPFADAERLGS